MYGVMERWRDPAGEGYHAPERWPHKIEADSPEAALATARADLLSAFGAGAYCTGSPWTRELAGLAADEGLSLMVIGADELIAAEGVVTRDELVAAAESGARAAADKLWGEVSMIGEPTPADEEEGEA